MVTSPCDAASQPVSELTAIHHFVIFAKANTLSAVYNYWSFKNSVVPIAMLNNLSD